ncbi:MAG: glycosyltransferase family 2 protein, partial [Acidobacteriota bacterium]
PEINMHSVKNRFLMRIKNMTGELYRRNWFSITARDIVVVGACLAHEWSSLKAFWYLAQNWRRVVEKRHEIMKRRRVKDEYISAWFSYQPVSFPAPRPSARALARARSARG